MEQTTAMESETYGEVEKSTSKHVSVDDGEFLYSLIDKGDEFIAGKFKRDVDTTLDARKNFARMAEYKKMKVLPDEKVEGRDCYVIEELNTGEFARQEKGSISYYCKETGIRLKNVSLNLAGEEIRENVVTELRVNEPIPKERFTFQAPPGVEVNDQTKNAEEGE
jgi:outer membrane lipoprotein-sorting protein